MKEKQLDKDQRYRQRLAERQSEVEKSQAMLANRSRVAKWRANNPDRVRESNAKCYAKNRDQIAKKRIANPDSRRVADANRRARKANAGGEHTAADLASILRLQRGKCAICGKKLDAARHADHIEPIARGGTNGKENLQLVCGPCNLQKGAKDPIAFARSIGRLC